MDRAECLGHWDSLWDCDQLAFCCDLVAAFNGSSVTSKRNMRRPNVIITTDHVVGYSWGIQWGH